MAGQHDSDELQNHANRIYTTADRLAAKLIVPVLLIGGAISALLGIAHLALPAFARMDGLLLLFGGIGAISIARLLKLLTDIENHLAAIRTQTGKGILSLLG